MDNYSYPRPPIQEAILDVFTTIPENVGLDTMEKFGEAVAASFPEKKPRHSVQGTFKFNPEIVAENEAASVVTHSGYIFRPYNGDRAVQARLDGFTYNRLPVYEGWNKFCMEARALWEIYFDIIRPVTIPRLGLRYLNVLEVPLPVANFQDYCTLFPPAAAMPSPISGYTITYSAPAKALTGAGVHVAAVIQPPNPTRPVLPLILDINISVEWNRPAVDASFWETFDVLRQEKNSLFERSITDKARALFQ